MGKISSYPVLTVPTGTEVFLGDTGTGTNKRTVQIPVQVMVSSILGLNYGNFTSTVPGLVPASGGGSANLLRADGSWTNALTGGLSVSGGTTAVQALTATTATFSGAFAAQSGITLTGALNVTGGTVTGNILPTANNTYALGSSSLSFSQAYFGTNKLPLYSSASGILGATDRTAGETNASVTPVDNSYAPFLIPRYKVNTTPGTTDMQPGFANALASAYVSSTDGVNSPAKAPAGIYGINAQIVAKYATSLSGDGDRSTRLLALSSFTGITTTGFVRLGSGAEASFGTRLSDMIIDCASIANSCGVFSSDIQDGGVTNVTVNNFGDYGFRFDSTGTTFASINGFLNAGTQAFKRNAGGTGGIAYYFKDGTFPAFNYLCQAYGNPANKLATGYYFTNIPAVMAACNVDGGGTIAIDLNASVPMFSIHGFTSNNWTTGVDISTVGSGVITGLYTIGATTSIHDAGNGGGIAKTITDASVPFYCRGPNNAHFDFLKIWGTLTIPGTTNLSGALTNTSTSTLSGGLFLGQSSTAPATASSGTITTADTPVSRVAPAGNITGVIMQAGTAAGQTCVVINESAFSITMAAAGTSNVADGTGTVIAANTAASFFWDTSTSRWYRT